MIDMSAKGRIADILATPPGAVLLLFFHDVLNDFIWRVLSMKFEGGCYCRKIRYVAEGEPRLKAQCLPRMPIHQRWCAEHVHAHGAARLSLHKRRTAKILAFRSRKPGDA
jgi:hypothetical protein